MSFIKNSICQASIHPIHSNEFDHCVSYGCLFPYLQIKEMPKFMEIHRNVLSICVCYSGVYIFVQKILYESIIWKA